MNKQIILLNYNKQQLDCKRKERAEKEREFRESVAELDVIIADLEAKVAICEKEAPKEDSDSEDEVRNLVMELLREKNSPDGLLLTEMEGKFRDQGKDISYKQIERCIKKLILGNEVEQANPGAQRYRRFRLTLETRYTPVFQ